MHIFRPLRDTLRCSLLAALFAGAAMPLSAAELTDLFQARVAAGQSQAQWQREALQAVLLKLTGNQALLSQPPLSEELRNSGQYVVQFQQVQQDGQAMLLVTLDGQKITQYLQQQQIPIWGARRPDVLLWLTERPAETPQFVLSPEHPLRKALQNQAALYGLSLQFPLYDEIDSTVVSEAASWGGDWTLLQQASGRYQADEVYNLLFDQMTDSTGLVQFRLTWQQQINGELQSKELLNADAMKLASQFCAELAASQAARYAVRTTATGQAGALVLTFDGVSSLTDLVALRRLMASQLTVREHQLEQYSAGQAVLHLQLASSAEEFYRALSLVRELTPVADTLAITPESTVSTGSSQSDTPGLQPAVTAADAVPATGAVLADAEAAMEAVLAEPPAQATAGQLTQPSVTAEGNSLSGNPLPSSQSTVPVMTTRYLFKRQ